MENYIYNDNSDNKNEFKVEGADNGSLVYDLMSNFVLDNLSFKPYSKDYYIKLNNLGNLKFFQDELTLKYNSKGVTSSDYAVSLISWILIFKSAQTNMPICNENSVFYYEVSIEEKGAKNTIAIGFSDKDFVLKNQVGTTSK